MLDFVKLLPHIREMVVEIADLRPQLDEAAALAASALVNVAAGDWEALSERIQRLPVSHLMATFLEPPDIRPRAPEKPGRHIVVSVDGSQIPADRHEIAHCYLINVGTVFLPYGSDSRVRLDSEPRLYFREDELLEEFDGELQPVTPRRIASRRLQAECRALGSLVEEAAGQGVPAVALVDGTLILWTLEAETPPVQSEVLADFEALLDRARELRIPVAGYISRPGSSDVVNTLKAWSCGLEKAACKLKCSSGRASPSDAPCHPLQKTSDLAVFGRVLAEGQRSALFGSQSKILAKLEPANRIYFFYLDTGKEVARVEIPAWAASDDELLERVHSVVLDQVDKGLGYPRALIEAHEKAVVRAPERSAFFQFIQREMMLKRVPVSGKRKLASKRSPSV